jgi:hypothetical protein
MLLRSCANSDTALFLIGGQALSIAFWFIAAMGE